MNDSAFIECPGCGLRLPDQNLDQAERFNASGECLKMYFELACWTLVQSRTSGSSTSTRWMRMRRSTQGEEHARLRLYLVFIGLYLAQEKGYTGLQVQRAHVKIGRTRRDWPRLEPPEHPAELTVMDVLQVGTDAEKEEMLLRWAASVWQSWEHRHQWVREMTERVLYGEGI